jgi:phage regulator Rha-like protein
MWAEKIAVLKEVLNPGNLEVDEDHLYVIDNFSVLIYSLKDYTLKKKFGKRGEGPQEFTGRLKIYLEVDRLLIKSRKKISYYTKNGDFKKEIRTKTGIYSGEFLPIGNGFIGRAATREENIFYLTVNFFDEHLNKGKEIYRIKSPFQATGDIMQLEKDFQFQVYKNKIYLSGKKGFNIDVLDNTGKFLFTITQKYEEKKFTGMDETKFRESLKRQYKNMYEDTKNRVAFPSHFPAVRNFFVADDKVYVYTWKWEKNHNELFIFDLKGNLLKLTYIPFHLKDARFGYPLTIKNNKVYQLIETPGSEEWELHITTIM